MYETGYRNPAAGPEHIGLSGLTGINWNWSEAPLYEAAICAGEGKAVADGPLVVETGAHTGRSAQDKHIVRTPGTENKIWWDNNRAMTREAFDTLMSDMLAHARGRTLYAQDLFGGADPAHRVATRIYTELAWQALFIRHLLIRPDREALTTFVPDATIIDLPSFRADPERHGCRTETVIACDLERQIFLIAGTSYAGEIKKSVFTLLNYRLPDEGVMPMHCSANVDDEGAVTVFFGLSGTGKTTLSADASRTLIGDDEHGWGPDGVFNFEGGCYAKTIRLSPEAEPEIFGTTKRFATVLENVIIDPETREPDFDDGSLTENTRAAYPIDYIPNASLTGRAGQPTNIVMLTADAFGVLPPIARMSPSQAEYHFLSGYTAKVAGTEKGVTEPQATFSTCFGAPFMPSHPSVYGSLLHKLIAERRVTCWLVNTGWSGGAYGTGHRMPIAATRTLLAHALDGTLSAGDFRVDPFFGLEVPVSDDPRYAHLLDPRATWADKEAYDAQALRLVDMFVKNFTKFMAHVDQRVIEAAPSVTSAAA
ncbi:MAG: phosphoenolpyruvate carboxykinase [Rhodobiaceae bacterium]|nr:phosphoenolpyruvate carboxykinase [Rhodobiaceae bacterium]